MKVSAGYFPGNIFAPADVRGHPSPRVFIAPQRYIQGPGVLESIGRYLSLLQVGRIGVLMSLRVSTHEGIAVRSSVRAAGNQSFSGIFAGEWSLPEIERHVTQFRSTQVDCVVALGGGKCVDAGKAVACRLGVPVVVVPTLASNDAPCSALSILYTPEGASDAVEFYPHSPAIVIIDTTIIAAAPERLLVAGMGDAMATWYEAHVCLLNRAAVTGVGARPTLASCTIGEACAHTLYADGIAAAAAVSAGVVNEALESVVEANTLLSGLEFESGGVAAAHGVAQSYTSVPQVHANFLHGEMVAMGTLTQLMMEGRPDEALRVAGFFAAVGLPIHLGQLSLDASDSQALAQVVDGTLAFPYTANTPMPVTATIVRQAIIEADVLGRQVQAQHGDAAYRRLHELR